MFCLLLTGLWARSWFVGGKIAGINLLDGTYCELASQGGQFGVLSLKDSGRVPGDLVGDYFGIWSYGIHCYGGVPNFLIVFPCWMSVVITGMVAASPWYPWSKRFRLRTLLIATTAVAVALWFIVWMTRR